ncbi:hypothetical protein BDZ88DRAFT_442518 [Geranomyces variabilis]|nr:hypothetical protein BDZ88DRAFT_442518 [Geranomyces variabilis]KAJ3131355.1 hypothetical protein HDU90_008346 [Geranomyces variabilis]
MKLWATALLFLALAAGGTCGHSHSDRALLSRASAAPSLNVNFITRTGHILMDGNDPLRFVSFNLPTLYNTGGFSPVAGSRGVLIRTLKKMLYYRNRRQRKASLRPDGQLPHERDWTNSESVWRTTDAAIALAGIEGVRLIAPFINWWSYHRGVAEFAAFRGKRRWDFFTDVQLRQDFKTHIIWVLERVNTVTGIKYKGTLYANVVADIKDSGIMDSPYIDVFSDHYYTAQGVNDWTTRAAAAVKYAISLFNKPFYVGEFGFEGPLTTENLIDFVLDSKDISGVALWSLRGHSRFGGFYKHYERDSWFWYHIPGFPASADPDGLCSNSDEVMTMAIMRNAAAKINGLAKPVPYPVPDQPYLFPPTGGPFLRWLGSAGASSYEIWRQTGSAPWTKLVDGITDGKAADSVLFADDLPA